MKRFLAFVISLIMLVGVFSALGVYAEADTSTPQLPEVVYWEDFSEAQRTGKINNSGSGLVINENNGFFLCVDQKNTHTVKTTCDFSKGTLNFLTKYSSDYFDIRFRRGSVMEKDLAQDFILSFRVKVSVENFTSVFSFKSVEEKSATVDSFKIKKGKFYVGDTLANTTETLPANEWVYLEIAFHYNESAKADNADYTGGAIDSYTIMLDGEALYTVNLTTYIQNYDFFRVFRSTGDNVLFEVDDVRVALGNTSLKVFDENGGVKKDDYTQNISWIKEKALVTDYAYSFCFVGDTQNIARYFPENMTNIYDWIVGNVESKKIAHVFGLGDITDTGDGSASEWDVAKAQINKLNGVVPYSLVRGNHDQIDYFNNYFCNDTYASQFEGFYENGHVENSWKKLDVCGIKYLLITLDDGPTDAMLEWADGIIKANRDRKVIITTHSYLSNDGDPLRGNDNGGPDEGIMSGNSKNNNDGYDIWNKLIYDNYNVFMVVGGHIDVDRVIQTKAVGKYGNEVIQILSDHQSVDDGVGPAGIVTMLYFSEDGRSIEVETYSTVRDEFYMAENQFSINLDVYNSGTNGKDGENGLTPYIGENGNWWIGDTDTGVKATGNDGADGKDAVTDNSGADGKDAVADNSGAATDILEDAGCSSSFGAGIAFVCATAIGACALSHKKKRK